MKRIPNLLPIAMSAALFLTATHTLTAQLPSVQALQADPDLVYLRVAAIEPTRNRAIRGLSKEQFKISEDNVPQDIVDFSLETLPLHLGILIDVSGTAKDEIMRAASALTRTGAGGDEFFLLDSGKASLNDAILQALKEVELRGNEGKRALMLVTSRKDPGSYPVAMVRERLKELDIQFYVSAHQTGTDVSGDSDRQVLKELTERTGGSAYFPSSTFEQTTIFTRIAGQLKNQYRIGYRSTNRAMDGKWRKVKITGEFLEPGTGKIRKLNVVTKPGYYAPKAAK